MTPILDDIDRKILSILQKDAMISMDALADQVHLSRNACWRRIKQLDAANVIDRRVAILNPAKIGLPLSVLVLLRAPSHDPDWLSKFRRAVAVLPEVQSAHRMSGDLDYVLRLRVASVEDYDRFYQNLIRQVPLGDVSASFVMEDIKDTTALPL